MADEEDIVDEVVDTPEVTAEAPDPEPIESLPAYKGIGLDDDFAKQYGIGNDDDPVSIAKKLAERTRTEEDRLTERMAQAQAEWERNWTKRVTNDPTFMRFQQQQREPPKPEETKDPLADWHKPPELDRNALARYVDRRVALGEDGQPIRDAYGKPIIETTWKDGTPEAVKQAVAEHEAYKERWQDEFFSNPREKLAALVRHEAAQIAEQQFGAFAQRYDEQQFFEKFFDPEGDNSKWLFARDAQDRIVIGFDDQPVLADIGKRLVADANQLFTQARGSLSRKQCIQMVYRQLSGEVALEKLRQQQELENADVEHGKRKTEARVPTKQAKRTGSLSQPENPRQPAQSDDFRELLSQQFDREGKDEAYFQAIGSN